MNREVFVFLVMVLCGMMVSLLLDFFRAFRISLKPGTVIVAISDMLFCILSLFIVIAAVWNLNNGEFRGFEAVGLVLGGIFYFLLLSRWILTAFLWIIENILKFTRHIFKILLTPSLFLYKILVVPIISCIKNRVRKDSSTYDERIQKPNN